MNRRDMCLDFKAKRVTIEAHVSDDIRFGATLKLNKVDVPATDYEVQTFIFDFEGEDVSETYNFTYEKFDGLIKFKLEDSVTTEMGEARWSYVIVITMLDDYDRSYVNGALILTERSIVE